MSLDSVVLLCWIERVLTQRSIDKVDDGDGVGGSSTISLLCCLMDLPTFLWLLFITLFFLPFIVVLCQWNERYVCYSTTLAVLYPRGGSGA